MVNNRIKFFTILILISIFFLGIAYANISTVDSRIVGSASVNKEKSVEIKKVEYVEDSNALYSDCEIINTSQTLMNSKITLGEDKNSYITYMVTVKNETNDDLYYIETVKNDEFYDNNDIVFNVTGIEQYYKLEKNEEVSFYITFKYIDGIDEISNNVLNSYLNFRFRKIFNVTYENIDSTDYPSVVAFGYDLNINLDNTLKEDIEIIGGCKKKFENGVLNLTDIESDLIIKKINSES